MIDFKNTTTDNIWWITKSLDETVIHYGMLEPQMLLQSGLTNVEYLYSESEWLTRLESFGIIISNE